ncbi:MAG: transcription antitermination protein NusB [Muribaculaceae bacterium]|nr:transcription antitermination protein NusB [Muribaculaceae bacterium]
MINRILIRIKVVQILYSYLLSRNEFKIDIAPENPGKERRFAYSVYLDTLTLIQELSGLRTNNPERSLPAIEVHPKFRLNRVGKALADSPQLKEITFKEAAHLNSFAPVLQRIADRLADASVFKDYAKKRIYNLEIDVNLWAVLLESVLLKDPDFAATLRNDPNFSLAGMHAGVRMAIDTIKEYNDTRAAELKAKNDLEESLRQAYDLYMALFSLIVNLTREQADRIENAKSKYLATAQDLNPNLRFVDNSLASMLENNDELTAYQKDRPSNWTEDPTLLKNLLDAILQSDIYKEYMEQESTDWHNDCEFWRTIMRNIILPSDALAEAMENKSVYWNDDLDIIGTFALKTLRRFGTTEPSECRFLPRFKDEEDAEFGARLFSCAVENRETYRGYIDRFISQDWDPDRLAFMDIVIMVVAIAEIVNFPGIPLPVSMNEYIEIANSYSTARSGAFINGILYSVVTMLTEEGQLRKPLTKPENIR